MTGTVTTSPTTTRRSRRPWSGFPESALDRLMSAHLSNAQYNSLVWRLYPAAWSAASRLRGNGTGVLGSEWSDERAVVEVVDAYIRPHLSASTVAGELGVGGGRIAGRIVEDVGQLYCFDVSGPMLKRARRLLSGHDHVRYLKLKRLECPAELRGRLDFVYTFDVLVHLDLHAVWRSFLAMHDLLAPGGRALVHVASLATPLGWEKFARQRGFSVSGFYFLCPELVDILAAQAGFTTVEESAPDPGNEYLSRDYLVVLEKTTDRAAPESRAGP
jgi:SAM-dependent methyltransferase